MIFFDNLSFFSLVNKIFHFLLCLTMLLTIKHSEMSVHACALLWYGVN